MRLTDKNRIVNKSIGGNLTSGRRLYFVTEKVIFWENYYLSDIYKKLA